MDAEWWDGAIGVLAYMNCSTCWIKGDTPQVTGRTVIYDDRTPPNATDDRVEARFVTYPDGTRPWCAGTVTRCVPAWIAPNGWDLHITLDKPPQSMNPGIVMWLDADGTNPDVRKLST